ncbi:MAG: hypothetical protein ACLQVJ_02905 [Syntrophobacteraceae bacterium]
MGYPGASILEQSALQQPKRGILTFKAREGELEEDYLDIESGGTLGGYEGDDLPIHRIGYPQSIEAQGCA